VRVFRLNDVIQWEQMGDTLFGEAALDSFGFSVALASDGLTLVVGTRDNDSAVSYSSCQVHVF
jgi:hypothetical protein